MSYAEDMLSPCSDRDCILRDPTDKTPRQYTNGGCQHLKERGPQLNKLLVLMGAEIARLRHAAGESL